jgi:hypothetical protein
LRLLLGAFAFLIQNPGPFLETSDAVFDRLDRRTVRCSAQKSARGTTDVSEAIHDAPVMRGWAVAKRRASVYDDERLALLERFVLRQLNQRADVT